MKRQIAKLIERFAHNANAAETLPALDARAKLAYYIIGANFVACLVASVVMGFTYSLKLMLPLSACLLIILGGCLSRRIGFSRLGGTLEAIGLLYLGGVAVEMLSLPLAATNLPYVDDFLARGDELLGVNVGIMIGFLGKNEALLSLTYVFYSSFHVQPFILFALLFRGQADRAWIALGSGLLALTITAALFPFFPAVEAYIHYGYRPGAYSSAVHELPWAFVRPLEMLRNGDIRTISPEYFKGYISFPSFHAAAAAIFLWAGWKTSLRWFFVVSNIGMALAAMNVGAHYLCDILGGFVVAAVTIPIVKAYMRRNAFDVRSNEAITARA